MKILKTSSIKKEFNNVKEDSFEMKLINKTKKKLSNIDDVFESKEIEIMYRKSCIYEMKYN